MAERVHFESDPALDQHWRPRIREQPLFNPVESPTDQTRDLRANDRIEIPGSPMSLKRDLTTP